MASGEIPVKDKNASFTITLHDKDGRKLKKKLQLPDTKTRYKELVEKYEEP